MLMEFKKQLKYLWFCIINNLKSSVVNKRSFILQSTLMALNNVTFLFFWFVIFGKNGGTINGVSMQEILYLWSIPVISFGLMFFIFGGIDELPSNISKGALDVYLTQPKNSLIGLITTKARVSAFGDLVYGLIIAMFAANFNILSYAFLLLLSVITAIVLTCIFIIVRLSAFWFGDTTQISDVYSNSLFLTLTIYPYDMFNSFIKLLMFTVIPAYYTAHLPIRIYETMDAKLLLVFTAIAVFLVYMTNKIYNFSLKRYASGNTFNLK